MDSKQSRPDPKLQMDKALLDKVTASSVSTPHHETTAHNKIS